MESAPAKWPVFPGFKFLFATPEMVKMQVKMTLALSYLRQLSLPRMF
jgi:hypothetical protein